MLQPHEVVPGAIGDATSLTLVIPRSSSEDLALVSNAGDELVAICLDPSGNTPFFAFDATENTAWKGVLISGITIEMDQASLFDPGREDIPPGALVRSEARLSIGGRTKSQFGRTPALIPILSGLPEGRQNFACGFRRWSVVLYRDLHRQELVTIDVSVKTGE